MKIKVTKNEDSEISVCINTHIYHTFPFTLEEAKELRDKLNDVIADIVVEEYDKRWNK